MRLILLAAVLVSVHQCYQFIGPRTVAKNQRFDHTRAFSHNFPRISSSRIELKRFDDGHSNGDDPLPSELIVLQKKIADRETEVRAVRYCIGTIGLPARPPEEQRQSKLKRDGEVRGEVHGVDKEEEADGEDNREVHGEDKEDETDEEATTATTDGAAYWSYVSTYKAVTDANSLANVLASINNDLAATRHLFAVSLAKSMAVQYRPEEQQQEVKVGRKKPQAGEAEDLLLPSPDEFEYDMIGWDLGDFRPTGQLQAVLKDYYETFPPKILFRFEMFIVWILIAFGHTNVIVGSPGVGKSLLVLMKSLHFAMVQKKDVFLVRKKKNEGGERGGGGREGQPQGQEPPPSFTVLCLRANGHHKGYQDVKSYSDVEDIYKKEFGPAAASASAIDATAATVHDIVTTTVTTPATGAPSTTATATTTAVGATTEVEEEVEEEDEGVEEGVDKDDISKRFKAIVAAAAAAKVDEGVGVLTVLDGWTQTELEESKGHWPLVSSDFRLLASSAEYNPATATAAAPAAAPAAAAPAAAAPAAATPAAAAPAAAAAMSRTTPVRRYSYAPVLLPAWRKSDVKQYAKMMEIPMKDFYARYRYAGGCLADFILGKDSLGLLKNKAENDIADAKPRITDCIISRMWSQPGEGLYVLQRAFVDNHYDPLHYLYNSSSDHWYFFVDPLYALREIFPKLSNESLVKSAVLAKRVAAAHPDTVVGVKKEDDGYGDDDDNGDGNGEDDGNDA